MQEGVGISNFSYATQIPQRDAPKPKVTAGLKKRQGKPKRRNRDVGGIEKGGQLTGVKDKAAKWQKESIRGSGQQRKDARESEKLPRQQKGKTGALVG